MSSFRKSGETITLVAPTGGVTKGLGYLIGVIFAIATTTVAAAGTFEGIVTGEHELPKVSTETWVAGDRIFWDQANSRCTNVAAGVREIGVAVAATVNPSLTGYVRLNGIKADMNSRIGTPVSIATAGAVTLTAAQLLAGLIVRDTNGASRTDTLPTAALLVAAIPGAQVGDIVRCRIINGADAAEVLTIAAGAGGAFDANQTASSQVVPQNASKDLIIRLTNVTAAAEAYVAYL